MNARPLAYDFARYLAAKRTVDDRALNAHVWATMAAAVQRRAAATGSLNILEIGAGIGTMVERAAAWALCPAVAVEYTAIDAEPANIAVARARLTDPPDGWDVRLETADLFAFVTRPSTLHRYDLIIAHAFLDLVDIPRTLPLLRQMLAGDGLFYFTINFDGATILQPVIDPIFDEQVESAYHQTMDERMIDGRKSGDSRSGRHLFGHLAAAGFDLRAAGASDWVVHAVDGLYPADEAYFLHFIVDTMYGALRGAGDLDAAQLADWIETRHRQIEAGELVYIAHQLDFFGSRRHAPSSTAN